MYKIAVLFKGRIKQMVPLRKNEMIIGRKDDSDIQLNDRAVSGHHARLLPGDGGVMLEDLQSTNGTRVNGEPVTRQQLQTGDQISVGQFKLIFVAETAEHSDDDPDATIALAPQPASQAAGQLPAEDEPASGDEKAKWVVALLLVIAISLLATYALL